MKIIYLDEKAWKLKEETEAYWLWEFENKILPSYLKQEKERCHYCNIEVYDISYHEQMTGIKISEDQEKTVDHVIPTSKGGLNISSNKVVCCRKCNYLKGDTLINQFKSPGSEISQEDC